MTSIQDIPQEIIARIAKYTGPREILRLSETTKSLIWVRSDKNIWKHMVKKYYPLKIMKELCQYEIMSGLLYDKNFKCSKITFEYIVDNKIPGRRYWYINEHNQQKSSAFLEDFAAIFKLVTVDIQHLEMISPVLHKNYRRYLKQMDVPRVVQSILRTGTTKEKLGEHILIRDLLIEWCTVYADDMYIIYKGW